MAHPRDEREWRKEVERRLQQQGSAVARVSGQLVPVIDNAINQIVGKQPTKPIELVAQTSIYMNTKGEWRGRFTLDFPDVTVATDGSPVTVAWYELQGSRGGVFWPAQNESPASVVPQPQATAKMRTPMLRIGGARTVSAVAMKGTAKAKPPITRSWDNSVEFTQVATSPVSSLRIDDLDPGSFWTFRARAMGANSVKPGQWSDEVEVTILHDTLPPPQLTKPIATVTRGTITVTWDGKSVSGQMPGDFVYAELAHGTDANPTEIVALFFSQGGFTVISDVPYYDPQFFRIRGVDETGNRGPWSQQEVAYVTPLVDEDVFLSKIDAAKTLLINVDAGVSILSDTILTRHLVITEDMTVALLAAHKIIAGDIAANAIEADKIKAGAVQAQHLQAELALISKIIAGDPNGTHAEMNQDGFRVFANDETDGIPNEVVRMGVASTDDYFSISRADGTLAATISQDGVGSFNELNANNAFYYKGNELQGVLDRLPRGPLFKAELSQDIDGITTTYGLVEAEYITDGTDRQIELSAGVLFYPVDPATEAYAQIRYTIDGSSPTINSTLLVQFPMGYISSSSYDHKDFVHTIRPVTMNPNLAVPNVRVRFLLTVFMGNGNSLKPRGGYQTYLYVTDIGPGIPHTANHNAGGGTITIPAPPPPPPAPVMQNYTQQWSCYDSRSYTGGGEFYNYNVGQMYQGLSPAGYGNLKSIALFGDMTGALAGATIHYVRVYFNFNHWYYNSGGTARIGVHGHTGLPDTDWGRGPLSVISGGWPKPGARWVELSSSHWDGFRTGEYRGVYLEGDGGYGTYGYADRPTIEIYYTK